MKKSIVGFWIKGLGCAFEDNDSDSDFNGFGPEDVIEAEKKMKEYNDYDLRTARELLPLHVDIEILEQWVIRDDDTPTSQKLTDEETVQGITGSDDAEIYEDEMEDEAPPSNAEVLRTVDTVAKVMQARNLIHDACAEGREQAVQQKVSQSKVFISIMYKLDCWSLLICKKKSKR